MIGLDLDRVRKGKGRTHLTAPGAGAGEVRTLCGQTLPAGSYEVVAERIEREELLSSGSEEEVEMRACAVQAVELIKAETGRTAMELDHLLWNRGQGAEYKARPRPRCRSVFY